MTLDEAIETLEKAIDNVPVIPSSKLYVAQRLGIEALKRFKQFRPKLDNGKYLLLPGETEE